MGVGLVQAEWVFPAAPPTLPTPPEVRVAQLEGEREGVDDFELVGVREGERDGVGVTLRVPLPQAVEL